MDLISTLLTPDAFEDEFARSAESFVESLRDTRRKFPSAEAYLEALDDEQPESIAQLAADSAALHTHGIEKFKAHIKATRG